METFQFVVSPILNLLYKSKHFYLKASEFVVIAYVRFLFCIGQIFPLYAATNYFTRPLLLAKSIFTIVPWDYYEIF